MTFRLSKNRIASLGRKKLMSWFLSTAMVLLIFEVVFIFIFPYIYMLVNSLKYEVDLVDSSTRWIITKINWDNYKKAFTLIDFWGGMRTNIIISLLCGVGHVLSCSLIGYGLARFRFKGRNFIFMMVIVSLIVPPQIFSIPLYMQYTRIGWIGQIWPIVVPSFFGFGLKGGLFVFIFRQYYMGLPKSYEEAARVEGCNNFSIFVRIILPISSSSILVTTILSVVWHWNDYFEPRTFLTGKTQMITQMIPILNSWKNVVATSSGIALSQSALAACVMSTLPLLVMYIIFQRRFISGVEHSGLAN